MLEPGQVVIIVVSTFRSDTEIGDYQIELSVPIDLPPWVNQAVEVRHQDSGLCVDVPGSSFAPGEGLLMWGCTGNPNQEFVLSPSISAEGLFNITNTNSGLCLDIAGGSDQDGARVVQNTCADTPSQRFAVQQRDDGVELRPSHAMTCLDASSDPMLLTPLNQSSCDMSPAQRFEFIIP